MTEQLSEDDVHAAILSAVNQHLRPLAGQLRTVNARLADMRAETESIDQTQTLSIAALAALAKRYNEHGARVDALINLAGIDPDTVKAEAQRIQQARKQSTGEKALSEAKAEHAAAVVRMVKHAEKADSERFDFENPEHSGGATAPGFFALKTPPRAEAGAKGDKGDQGEKGDKGDTGPAPKHEWKKSKLRFSNPDGTWGELVDLKGPKGDKGEPGKPGKDGGIIVIRSGGSSSGVDLSTLPGGDANAEPASIPVMQGGRLVNLPWSGFLSVITGALDTGSDHARREDFASETVLYRGEAAPGTAEDAAAWKIRRVEFFPDGDVTTTFAAGNAEFVHVWADRAALQYS